MSELALIEVQRALYTKLHGDAVLMGMVNGVFDVVPQKTALPYVVIGDGQMRVLSAEGLNLNEVQLLIEVWGEADGRKRVLSIMRRLFLLLHLGTLTLNGFEQVSLRCEQADTEIDEQATRVRGTMTVRASVVEI